MSAQKSLAKNAVFNFIKCFSNIIFPIISFPYASRILLPQGIGAVNFANSTVEYFILIAELGIGTYAAREAARIRDDRTALTKFTKEILLINFFTTILAYSLLILSLIFVSKFSDYRMLLIVCSTKVLFTTLGIEWLFVAKEEYGYITIRHGLFQIISLVLLFTLVKSKDDYLIYTAIGVFSNVGANIFNFIYSRKFINLFEKTPLEIKKHIKPICTFFGMRCADKVNNLLDTTMLGFISGDISVGFYSAATKLSKMVRELITSVIASFMPRSSYFLEKKNSDEYMVLVKKVCNVTFFFSIPAALGLFVLAEPLTILFCGEKYLAAVSTMQLLSFCIVTMSLNSYLSNLILTPNKLEGFMLYAQLVSLFVNLCLNYFFIKKWGVFGAGLATLIVESVLPAVKLIPSWKYIKDKSNLINLLKALIGSALMFFLIYFFFINITNNLLKIIISVFSGAFLYAIVEVILKHPTATMILKMIAKRFTK